MANPTIGFRPSAQLADWLDGRAERAGTVAGGARARIELDMWRDCLRAELGRIRLTLAEIGIIADVCNGTMVSDAIPLSLGHVAADVLDAIRLDGTTTWSDKWGIDAQALAARLMELGPVADMALTDAIARWWATDGEHTAEGWAAVGVSVRGEVAR